ncbi:MAG: glycosyltransferase, partial [Propionicimonas sp.]|nr:glycosyltransferase [Propionicimonas sp.]
PRTFHPGDTAAPTTGGDVVFVGRTRTHGPRAVVMDALAAGIDVRVWGDLWERYIPERHIVAEYLPNDQLSALYRSAGVVLSDHHEDMGREGFVANRLFDAVASGARVVSDPVEGIDELFGGAVQVYESLDDLRRLTSPEGIREAFPQPPELLGIARRVIEEHSFQRRAATILADVLEVWKAGHE